MSAKQGRCPTCRGSGFIFDPFTNTGDACVICDGTGVTPSRDEVPEGVRMAVRARSGGVCEACHAAPATDQHHRQYRSRGGWHLIENLLDLCGRGNTSGCHGDAHRGRLEGASISAHEQRPIADVPFVDARGQSWLLNTDGTKQKGTSR